VQSAAHKLYGTIQLKPLMNAARCRGNGVGTPGSIRIDAEETADDERRDRNKLSEGTDYQRPSALLQLFAASTSRKICTDFASSSGVAFRGGNNRTTFPPALGTSKPLSRMAAM
jgi:hypothetical protein